MSQIEQEILADKIAAVREICDFIDKRSSSLIDAETRLEEAIQKEKELNDKFNIKNIIIYSILASFVLLIPMSLLSMVVSLPLYFGTPIVSFIGIYIFANNYKKKQMPPMIKANKRIKESAEIERNDLANVINQSYYNIKAEIDVLLRQNANFEMLEILSTEGFVDEALNVVALDYMYHAVKKGYAKSFSDAVMHFREISEKLSEQKDEESIKLYEEIQEGNLRAEYRAGIVLHCEDIKKELNKSQSEDNP